MGGVPSKSTNMSFAMRYVRTALLWILIGILASFLVLLAILPAAWITPQFTKASHGYVNLVESTGSFWDGSALLMLSSGPDKSEATILPGRIEWQTAFWPLFRGHLKMRVRQTEVMPEAIILDLDFTTHRTILSAGTSAMPASLLRGFGAPFNTLDLQGDVQFMWTQWQAFGNSVYGCLTVTLNDMSSRVSLVKPLGSYRVLLQAQGALFKFNLSTLKGPLLLDGRGTISSVGSISFQGIASTAPDTRDNFAGLLNLLGRPTGPGKIALTFLR